MTEAAKSKGGGCFKLIGMAVVGFIGLVILVAIISPSDKKSDTGDAAAAPSPAIEVSAVQLARAYASNEVAAQKTYGDHVLVVTGRIERISLDFADNPTVSFVGAEMFQSPQAGFSKDDADAVGQLQKGQVITVRCEDVSEIASIPMLKDCKLN